MFFLKKSRIYSVYIHANKKRKYLSNMEIRLMELSIPETLGETARTEDVLSQSLEEMFDQFAILISENI